MTDISAIITAHGEGLMAGVSFHSLRDAVEVARADGLDVEMLVVLDRPNPATSEVFEEAEAQGARVVEVSYGDQGRVRNHGAGLATGDYIAFLDGDDLWSENWLADAYPVCAADPGRVIAHPELNWFFEQSGNLFFMADQTDPAFDPAYLRFANYWDALCLAPAAAHLEHPFSDRDIAGGFAYEDWHWNLETVVAGFQHRVVPETIHFKRRRRWSQTLEASQNASLPRPAAMLDFAWYAE